MKVDQKGFSLIESLLVMACLAILLGLATLNLSNIKHRVSVTEMVDTFLADLKGQQLKAMVGDTEGRTTTDNYGIHFESTTYTLFHGTTYSATDAANFKTDLTDTNQITTTFPSSQILFLKGSGEVSGYVSSSATITLRDTTNNYQKVITVNRYGVVTGIN